MEMFKEHKPDGILIEKKASGQSLIQDLRQSGIPVLEYNPDKDKIARAHSITPLFEAGRVWKHPNRRWADEVIDECANFPNAPHDDYVDTVTQALIWLKAGQWIRGSVGGWYDVDEQPERKTKRLYW